MEENYNKEQETRTENAQPTASEPVQNAYSASPAPSGDQDKKGFAIASLVLGIVAVVFMCCFWYVGIVCGVIGLVLGVLANKQKKNGLATAGIVLSIIALALGVICIILIIAGFGLSEYSIQYFMDQMQ